MPRLSNIIKDRAEVRIPMGGETLTVTYHPSVITPELQEGVIDAERTGSIREALYAPLSQLIVEWDLTDDDDKVYATTVESLRRIPSVALVHVLKAIFLDLAPNGMRGSNSGSGSSRAETSEPHPTGTGS